MYLFLSRLKTSFIYILSIAFGSRDRHLELYVDLCTECYCSVIEEQDLSELEHDQIVERLTTEAIVFSILSSSLYSWFPKTRDRLSKEIYFSCKRKADWRAKNV